MFLGQRTKLSDYYATAVCVYNLVYIQTFWQGHVYIIVVVNSDVRM